MENTLAIQVGDKVKVGVMSSKECGIAAGTELTFTEGHFERENGLWCENFIHPGIWDEKRKEWDSDYHIFGNDYEYFLDSEIISGPSLTTSQVKC